MTNTTILYKVSIASSHFYAKQKIYCFAIFFLLLFNLTSFGQHETAIQLYDQKKYTEALAEWNKILATGAKGEDLYYNIANTYYQQQQYAEAILFYSKALKWNPNCKDCKQNLKLAQKAAGVESFELPEFILTKLYHSLLLSLQPMIWFAIGIFFVCLFLYLFLLKKNSPALSENKTMLYFIALLGITSLVLAWQRDEIKQRSDEVILMKASKLYLSPETNSESRQDLNPGQQLLIKDHLSGWIKVQTKEFDLGWIEENKVEVINL